MKNVVFMMDIDLGGQGRYSSARRLPYKYSISSWKQWCKSNDIELFILDELLLPQDQMAICWQRYYLFDILEANNIEYDQVLMVDADTIIHPDCPNFFNMTDGKMCGVDFDGSYDWVMRSIENYSKYVFDGYMMPWFNYFDCGFVLVNKSHKELFQSITDFYNENSHALIQLQDTFHLGTDQTPVNMLTNKHNIDLKLLPYEFNMSDMNRKNILTDDLLFTKIGWIYQFNCIPNNEESKATLEWMKNTYELLYGKELV